MAKRVQLSRAPSPDHKEAVRLAWRSRHPLAVLVAFILALVLGSIVASTVFTLIAQGPVNAIP